MYSWLLTYLLWQLDLYMNKFFDNSKDTSIKTMKWNANAKTTKERLDKLAIEVNGAVKRANSSKATLKRVMMEDIHLEAIWEGRAEEIRKWRQLSRRQKKRWGWPTRAGKRPLLHRLSKTSRPLPNSLQKRLLPQPRQWRTSRPLLSSSMRTSTSWLSLTKRQ